MLIKLHKKDVLCKLNHYSSWIHNYFMIILSKKIFM